MATSVPLHYPPRSTAEYNADNGITPSKEGVKLALEVLKAVGLGNPTGSNTFAGIKKQLMVKTNKTMYMEVMQQLQEYYTSIGFPNMVPRRYQGNTYVLWHDDNRCLNVQACADRQLCDCTQVAQRVESPTHEAQLAMNAPATTDATTLQSVEAVSAEHSESVAVIPNTVPVLAPVSAISSGEISAVPSTATRTQRPASLASSARSAKRARHRCADASVHRKYDACHEMPIVYSIALLSVAFQSVDVLSRFVPDGDATDSECRTSSAFSTARALGQQIFEEVIVNSFHADMVETEQFIQKLYIKAIRDMYDEDDFERMTGESVAALVPSEAKELLSALAYWREAPDSVSALEGASASSCYNKWIPAWSAQKLLQMVPGVAAKGVLQFPHTFDWIDTTLADSRIANNVVYDVLISPRIVEHLIMLETEHERPAIASIKQSNAWYHIWVQQGSTFLLVQDSTYIIPIQPPDSVLVSESHDGYTFVYRFSRPKHCFDYIDKSLLPPTLNAVHPVSVSYWLQAAG